MVPALEALLFEPLPVLDQGFIRVVDFMGDDAAVVQAARVSYGEKVDAANSGMSLREWRELSSLLEPEPER